MAHRSLCWLTLTSPQRRSLISPFPTKDAMELLAQVLVISYLDYCNSLLAGLPASVTIPLQRIQKAAARLVYNLPKFSHVTPLFHDLHWLPVVAHTQFNKMVLTFKVINRTAPSYLKILVRPHTPVRALRSSTSPGLLVPPSLRAKNAHSAKSRLISVLAPQWWNELPTNVKIAESLSNFCKRIKTHLFRFHLDST